ncbi:MAG TPA: LysM peptidoglycan-binding domain-containing protein, partial [Gammaproteobacteria bacterium]|nr:LysM peptidoglycan-binding domain-containing protein [Gammaproteobacteria bacterium]
QLNAGFNRSSTAKKGPYKLVLPIEHVQQFTENLAKSPYNSPINWLHYQTKTGDTVDSIAKKFNTTPHEIRKLNYLSSNNRLQRHTNLLIPSQHGHTLSEENELMQQPTNKKKPSMATMLAKQKKPSRSSANNASLNKEQLLTEIAQAAHTDYQLQPGDTIYLVRAKDTLPSIAKRFRVDEKLLQVVNKLAEGKVTPGHQLIIPTHSAILQSKQETAIVSPIQEGEFYG